ncbi:MAG TPA: hypothetical protein VG916_13035 [Gemmatimonadaceae bacterium]|nr:hypothetical protein [Gemmatimonadaceae bacterium]
MYMGLTTSDIAMAWAQPVRFVAKRAYGFASSFALVALAARILFPQTTLGNDAPSTLFVAVFGGVVGAVIWLSLARHAKQR